MATAARVQQDAIQVDGVLDEEAWQGAPALTDFVQREPEEGAPPTQEMEVRFVYDESALYIGARMYGDSAATIQAPLGRRDNTAEQSEHILVSLDTFLDRRTAYTFGVSASGVRFDRFHPRDEEGSSDSGFDPVWEARTRVDREGWTAELWIPFSQLRFNEGAQQVWGLNIRRFTPTREEEVYWILVPRTEQAWASRFGDLTGISGVRPTRRLELLPVAVGSSALAADRDPNDPFDDGRNLEGRVGLDVKMGLGPNLTLDGTINPDFGQVEADPAEVNLTAFSTRFPERRPFFTEGAGLLNINHNNTFYTRRIGAAPLGPASGDFVDYPKTSTILGAAKVTGRLSGGTSLGVLAAVTGEEHAKVADSGTSEVQDVRVGPRTVYGVVKFQRELGPSGSTAGIMVAGMRRALGDEDPLTTLLSRNALLYGGEASLRFRGGEYRLSAAFLGSYVSGEPEGIERMQRSSTLYMQRPDREYGHLDTTRTSLAGFSPVLGLDRLAGRHWLFGVQTKIDSHAFQPNDLGNLTGADGIEPNFNVTYRETQPGRLFRNYSVTLSQMNEWNFSGDRQRGSITSRLNTTWTNFWTSSIYVTRNLRLRSSTLTRGGPLMGTPHGWSMGMSVGNSSTSQNRWTASASVERDELGGESVSSNTRLSLRPDPRWELSVAPSYNRSIDPQQYVTTLGDGPTATFGSRYVFAYTDRTTLSAEFRMGFTLKPDLNLEVYAEPFTASGRYYGYGELLSPGSRERLEYGAPGTALRIEPDGSRVVTVGGSTFTLRNRDFNVRSFQSNVVLRWEWRPGSTMYLVWQQNREQQETVGTRVGPTDLFTALTEPGTNILLFKTSFWIPVE